MRADTCETLARRLADVDRVVEIGIGNRPDVAAALAEKGVTVTATDIVRRPVPDAVRFVRDDVTDPDEGLYEGAETLYALNLPPELHRPTAELAQRVDAAFLFTTLGGDLPTVPVTRETIPGGTLFVFDPQRP